MKMKNRPRIKIFLLVILALGGLSFPAFMPTFSLAIEKQVSAPTFSLDVKNIVLKNVLKYIADATGYKIDVNDGWENEQISAKLKNAPLPSGLRHVLRSAHIRNYALLFNEEDREIRLIICSSGVSRGDVLTNRAKEATEVSLQQTNRQTKEGSVTPPSSSGMGLTQEELDAIIARQERISDGSIVTPPCSDGSSGLTLFELKAMEEQQKNVSEDAISTPPSSDGSSGLTLRELNALQEQQEMVSDDTIISPPSVDGSPGLTLGELKRREEIWKTNQTGR